MIILVVEEIIPLIVLYAPFILPSTCILPTQKDRIDAKRREKQRVFVMTYSNLYAQLARDIAVGTPVDSALTGVSLKSISG